MGLLHLLSEFQSPSNQRIIAIILFSFLGTFLIARLFVYLVLDHLLPNFFLTVKGVHIHHYTYGVFLLVIIGFYLLLVRPSIDSLGFVLATFGYGVGLGLTFDEFGMWIHLRDDYWIRQSYDAVIIVSLILLNVIYYKSVLRVLTEITSFAFRAIT